MVVVTPDDPAEISGRLQVTTPPLWLHVPAELVTLTNCAPLGSVSVMETPVAGSGPAFVVVRV